MEETMNQMTLLCLLNYCGTGCKIKLIFNVGQVFTFIALLFVQVALLKVCYEEVEFLLLVGIWYFNGYKL